ncbi:S8 family serine peptidase [Sphingomicrobium astaxanthinifaciens]|uniref:S8 family serine peptidase n=1 Tax=Sphingomicrobium astaxanthinifaciens TaxID=1227949 RepID=UPI001FCAAB98|nr:S8 family serine peptidase [Sphingomicrobium astaxanthinifaciens]MCJ7421367.1 S8 family serine peptidase [Sphingomicrobium astaxanthinifaciens]
MSTRLVLLASLALAASPASAQLLPSPGQLVAPVRGALPPLPPTGIGLLDGLSGEEQQAAQASALPSLDRGTGARASAAVGNLPRRLLADLREQRLAQLIADHPEQLDRDRDRNPVRRGELLLVAPDALTIARAQANGFEPLRRETIEGLGIELVVVAIGPEDDDVREAHKRLVRLVGEDAVDYNHVFEPAGGALLPASTALAASARSTLGRGHKVAIIDGGVAAHAAMRGAAIRQRGLSGKAVATGHGTAVASLLLGQEGRFRGAAPGLELLVADVYGGNPAAGAASVIARAIGWAAANGAEVVNISLVGPPNRLIERAVAAARARGVAIVAAVGNDGPAAPPAYPASYDGVVAVTGVDEDRRALREATRNRNLAFAAPGADLAAAAPAGGYVEVRGTSFAAPLASARLALAGSRAALEREAVKGRGRVGKGVVCLPCRVDPETVAAK